MSERDTEPTVIKECNQFVLFKFLKIQFFVILKFLGGATNIDSFLKSYETSMTNGFFPDERLNHPDKLNKKIFFAKTLTKNYKKFIPFEKQHLYFEKLICSDFTADCGRVKMRLSKIRPTGTENYSY